MSPIRDPEVFREVLEELSTGVYVVDRERRILFWNRGAEKISGHLSQYVVGRCCGEGLLAECDENSKILCGDACPLVDTMKDGRSRALDLFLRHKAGHRVAVHVEARPVRNSEGTIIGAAASFFERRYVPEPDRRLNSLPAGDNATGLPDAQMVEIQLRQSLEDFREQGTPFCLLHLRVDELDALRTTRGREAGDSILRVVAQTLQNILRPTDVLGHCADDDFLIVVRNCHGSVLSKVAGRLEKIVRRSGIAWWGDEITATLSVGATAAVSGDTTDTIQERAHRGLAESIRNGGNCVTILSVESEEINA
jgi:diguanylate cyclase (GGDEF)-like protein/PAS domain S-box-containing protein